MKNILKAIIVEWMYLYLKIINYPLDGIFKTVVLSTPWVLYRLSCSATLSLEQEVTEKENKAIIATTKVNFLKDMIRLFFGSDGSNVPKKWVWEIKILAVY